jgi:hypothetical protein
MGANANPYCCDISRSLLLSYDKTSRHPTKAIASRDRCGECRSLPLTDNVRGQVGIHRCPIADVCSCCKIGAYIRMAFWEAKPSIENPTIVHMQLKVMTTPRSCKWSPTMDEMITGITA